MKVLLDACVSPKAKTELEAAGHDVVWTGDGTAARFMDGIRQANFLGPIYLSRKAAERHNLALAADGGNCPAAGASGSEGVWVVVSLQQAPVAARDSFQRRYQARTGSPPSVAVAEAYDAVRLIASGLRAAGPNRARLRDYLARLSNFTGVSGNISFDEAGNNQALFVLTRTP